MDNIHQLVSSLRMVQSLISKEQNSKKVSKVYRQKASPDWLEIQPRQSNPTTNPQTNIREGLQIISQLLANVKEDLLNFEKQVTIWNSEGTSMHSLVMMKNEMLKSIELLQAMHQFITKNRQNFLYSESKRMVDNLRKSAQSLQSQTVVLYTMSQEKSESLDVVSWFKIVKRWFKLKCLSMFNPISFKDLNFKRNVTFFFFCFASFAKSFLQMLG